jgi:cyclophilin family peptidyl-prolyl cis-trans isomerase
VTFGSGVGYSACNITHSVWVGNRSATIFLNEKRHRVFTLPLREYPFKTMGTDKRTRKKENRRQRLDELAKTDQKRKVRKNIIRALTVVGVVVGVVVIIRVSGGTSGSSSAPTDTKAVVDSGSDTSAPTLEGREITGDTPCPAADMSETRVSKFEKAPPMCIEDGKTYTAMVSTNKGDFAIVLDPIKAPLATNNFVVLARYKYFDGTKCHRAITDFVVQCGDPTATGTGGPGYSFVDELPAKGEYKIGSIAMANSGPNTNGSQFFIITGENGATLKPDYTLFGQVTEGLDQTIPALNAASNPDPAANGVPPTEDLIIISVAIIVS